MSTPVPGTCRYCGCQGEACTLPNGDKCGWVDESRTVCNAPGCQRAELARVKSTKSSDLYERLKEKYRGWGYGAIQIEERRRRQRERRRRRRRAA